MGYEVLGIFGSILIAVLAGAWLFRIGKKITVNFDDEADADELSKNEGVSNYANDRTDAEGRK